MRRDRRVAGVRRRRRGAQVGVLRARGSRCEAACRRRHDLPLGELHEDAHGHRSHATARPRHAVARRAARRCVPRTAQGARPARLARVRHAAPCDAARRGLSRRDVPVGRRRVATARAEGLVAAHSDDALHQGRVRAGLQVLLQQLRDRVARSRDRAGERRRLRGLHGEERAAPARHARQLLRCDAVASAQASLAWLRARRRRQRSRPWRGVRHGNHGQQRRAQRAGGGYGALRVVPARRGEGWRRGPGARARFTRRDVAAVAAHRRRRRRTHWPVLLRAGARRATHRDAHGRPARLRVVLLCASCIGNGRDRRVEHLERRPCDAGDPRDVRRNLVDAACACDRVEGCRRRGRVEAVRFARRPRRERDRHVGPEVSDRRAQGGLGAGDREGRRPRSRPSR